jgi:hypothetical protein
MIGGRGGLLGRNETGLSGIGIGMMTTIETKKKIPQLIREYFHWGCRTWPLVLLFMFIYFHGLLLGFFPGSKQAIQIVVGSIYQLIGVACVLLEINQNLMTLKKIDLKSSAKQFWISRPKRMAKQTVVNLEAVNITCRASAVGVTCLSITESETLGQKVERLSKKITEIEGKVEQNRKDLTAKLKDHQNRTGKDITTLRNDIRNLNGNLVDVVVGDYKKAIFGILMIMYGICVPVLNLCF